MKNNISSVILSGGKNIRMGNIDKAFIPMGGVPIIRRTINLLKEIFDEIIIVTNNPKDYKLYGNDCRIVPDIIKDVGPLGGIHSALTHATKQNVFIFACDMPNLCKDLIIRQMDYFNEKEYDVLMPRFGTFFEPLHAVYKKSLKDNLEFFMKNNSDYRIRSFTDTINVGYLDLEGEPFFKKAFENLNTLEELDKYGR